jgi:hypothetical protein
VSVLQEIESGIIACLGLKDLLGGGKDHNL